MQTKVLAWVASSAFLLAGAAHGNPQDDTKQFEIRLFRPSLPGEVRLLKATARRATTNQLEVAGEWREITRREATIELQATERVVEVGKEGNVHETQLDVESCRFDVEGESGSLKKGTVVRAYMVEGKTKFEIDGVPADQSAAAALSLLISLEEVNPDDDIFGTRTRQSVGDSWRIDKARFARKVQDSTGLAMPEDSIDGHGTLRAIRMEKGVRCLDIGVEVSASGFKMPAGSFPPHLTVESTRLEARFEALAPVKRERPLSRQKMWFRSRVVLSEGENGRRFQSQHEEAKDLAITTVRCTSWLTSD